MRSTFTLLLIHFKRSDHVHSMSWNYRVIYFLVFSFIFHKYCYLGNPLLSSRVDVPLVGFCLLKCKALSYRALCLVVIPASVMPNAA